MTAEEEYPAGEPGVIDIGARHFIAPLATNHQGRTIAWRWWHDCPITTTHTSWQWFGDDGEGTRSGHVLTTEGLLTVTGSLACPDCGDHGFIENGRWRAV